MLEQIKNGDSHLLSDIIMRKTDNGLPKRQWYKRTPGIHLKLAETQQRSDTTMHVVPN
jgi:hypothetical protein